MLLRDHDTLYNFSFDRLMATGVHYFLCTLSITLGLNEEDTGRYELATLSAIEVFGFE